MSCWCHGTSACTSGQCLTVPPGQWELFSPSPLSLPAPSGQMHPLALVFCPLCLNLKAPHTQHARERARTLPIPPASRAGQEAGAPQTAPRHPRLHQRLHPGGTKPCPFRTHVSSASPPPAARDPRPHSQCSSRLLPRWCLHAPGWSPCLCSVPLCLSVLSRTLTPTASPQPPRSQPVFMSQSEPGPCAASSSPLPCH